MASAEGMVVHRSGLGLYNDTAQERGYRSTDQKHLYKLGTRFAKDITHCDQVP